MFKRALICTDFEDGLQRLVHFVPSLAASGLEQITFFHNVSLLADREIPRVDTEQIEAAREQLSAAQQSVPDGVVVEIEVQSGKAADNIIKVAKSSGADILFLGMPTRSILNEKLFGSTTLGIAKQVDLPLMILRPQLIATYREQELALRTQHLFQYFLLPYDGSESAKQLIQQVKERAAAIADCELEQCLLCWVIDDSSRRELQVPDPVGHAEAELESVRDELESVGLKVSLEVRQGNPLEEILKSAEVNDITAIAVRSGSSSFIARLSVPSFTSALLRSSWHPIVRFPSEHS
ncbi:MAG: universal stress protein [Leptolyngbya sp. SIO4C1]|nr:universal stress protein [Leptolyngbya sp. SIO4C1]